MTQKTEAIPFWILIITGLFALLDVAVGASLVFTPASVLPNVDLQAKGVTYLIQMWAARQFALGFIFGYAVFKRSASMLRLAYLFFLVMNIADFFIGVGLKDASLYVGAAVMCLISSAMIFFISRKSKGLEAETSEQVSETPQKPEAIPTWILIISALFALMEVGVSAAYVFAPESVLENVDLQAKGVTYLIQIWAARQFALGFIFGYAVFKRSASMLTLAYLFFFVMLVGDFFIGIGQNDASIYGSAVVMGLISAVFLFFLKRKETNRHRSWN